MITKDDVVEALHDVEDPELGMDIVELGLYYDAEIEGERVKVIHSLTSMGCPAGPMMSASFGRRSKPETPSTRRTLSPRSKRWKPSRSWMKSWT